MMSVGPGLPNDGNPAEDRAGLLLVVEDDAALRTLIERSLAGQGYQTIGAADGTSALALLEQHNPQLMLLDYSLPDMRGEQLLERIAALGRRVPFVVATGHGSESVAVEMMKRGAYDYLVKGVAFMKLLPAVIQRALERVRQAERLAETEEQLRRAHEELEQRVRLRTAELAEANQRLLVEMEERRRAEDQLHQRQTELAHVARLSTVGEMVAELAHELNQPLSAISSYAHACKRLLDGGGAAECKQELRETLGQVSDQADRAAEIIRRLRRFVSKAKPLKVSIDFNEVVRDVYKLMSIDARMANAEVGFVLAEPLPPVVGDRIQLEQVLVNMMRNAIEAVENNDGHERRIAIRTALDDRQRIAVEVEDNGPGVPPDVKERIFDRFFTTKPNGMGMGLAISQSIIENHGGKMWLTPAPQRGAIFHFTLPVDAGEHIRGK
jgi:C4-dicarboxylate-specific signal transduction histidine kinase